MPLQSSQINIALTSQENVVTGGSTDTHQGNLYSNLPPLTPGTGPNSAQKVANLSIALTTSPVVLDLTALAGGIAGAAINFSLIKQVVLQNSGTTAASLTLGANPATNLFPGAASFGPGAMLARAEQQNGMVVDATHKTVTLAAAANTTIVNLIVVGEGV